MKKIILTLVIAAGFVACGATTDDESFVNGVDTLPVNTLPDPNPRSLPVLIFPKITITNMSIFNDGDTLGAFLTFSYSSCAQREWIVTLDAQDTSEGKITHIWVKDAGDLDCLGPIVRREYIKWIEKDVTADKPYVLANPSVLEISVEK